MSSGETPKQPSSDGIEKRSKSEELEQREAKRPRSSLPLPTAPEQPYYDLPTILEVPASVVEKAGLLVENEKVVMYCREKVKELFRFLEDVLRKRRKIRVGNNPYQQPWIIGPPGVGKSLAVVAFTQSPQVSDWAVTWIRCKGGGKFRCYHRYRTEEKIKTYMSNGCIEYLNGLELENQHILVLDGFTSATSNEAIKADCESWLQDDFEKRRLFVVCSMASCGKSREDDDMKLNVKEFPVCSWELEEYKAAVKEPKLYDSVKEKLGTDTDKSRDELVESKYYFGGGNVRLMFQTDTGVVKVALDQAIETVEDIQTFRTGSTGLSSNAFVHRLISIQDGIRGRPGIRGIVSQYAGTRLAVKLGTGLVERFTRLYQSQLNQSMKGFLFEMWFFAKLSREGLSYDLIDGGSGKTWAKSNLVYLPSKEERLVRESPTWFQPAWTNGGFDAVYVDPQKKTVRFVQITLFNHHSFKIHFFYKFLNRLRNYMHTETLEIFFVYPKGAVPQKPETTGQGLLTEFQWKNGEEWEKVTKVRLDWPG